MDIHRGGHVYLRAYMAGIVVPVVLLTVALLVYVLARLVWEVPFPLERVLVFPMAVVPNLWGLWNLLYIALNVSRRLPIGCYGAILPVLLLPMGWRLARTIDVEIPALVFAIALVGLASIYYLVWRYIVAVLNEIVGVGGEPSPHAV